ncbi:cupin domain-containing protein [Salsipaludibacter albus]|uniref:cupin domain-containing protein n=1 Tax=Salsipaludibacter albus TaxID=2849650 RepID=UPI001EE4C2EE|nr:cupin domain-containing protein [Salsipaludibacter albus]MBY5162080.1 cupin domain-containing protein [Salsipaludibacter albus]
MTDHGREPYIVDIEQTTLDNATFRTTLWTGEHLQLTVMGIAPGDDIGLEVHPDNDQFLRLEQGRGRCQMGPSEDDLPFDEEVSDDWAILVPAGTWHNVTNIGDEPMKVYALYGPPDHVPGTVHQTHDDARNDPNED